jgi:RNA polymerase sigma factor for flagellar operon FliA
MDWSPRVLRRKARLIEEAYSRFSARLGRAPNEGELAQELSMDLAQFQQLLAELDGLELGSLHVESGLDGKEEDLCEYLPDTSEEGPFHRCLRSEMKQLLGRLITELPEKEQQVLALYYYEELTMKEVGAVLGVGESRVSQIHTMAVLRLRARLQEVMRNDPGSARAATTGA